MGNRPKLQAAKPQVSRAAATDRVVVAYIHPGQTSAYFTQSLVNLLMFDQATEPARRGLPQRVVLGERLGVPQQPDAPLPRRVRRRVAAVDRRRHGLRAHRAGRLLASADPAERPIVGGLCFGASFGALFPTIYQFVETEDGMTTIRVEDYPTGWCSALRRVPRSCWSTAASSRRCATGSSTRVPVVPGDRARRPAGG
jgi:hypothetical protein